MVSISLITYVFFNGDIKEDKYSRRVTRENLLSKEKH